MQQSAPRPSSPPPLAGGSGVRAGLFRSRTAGAAPAAGALVFSLGSELRVAGSGPLRQLRPATARAASARALLCGERLGRAGLREDVTPRLPEPPPEG